MNMLTRIDLKDEIKETEKEIAHLNSSIEKLSKLEKNGAKKEILTSRIFEKQMMLEYLQNRLQRYFDYMHTPMDSYNMRRRTIDSFFIVIVLIAIACALMAIFIMLGNLLGKT